MKRVTGLTAEVQGRLTPACSLSLQ